MTSKNIKTPKYLELHSTCFFKILSMLNQFLVYFISPCSVKAIIR